MGAAAVRSLLDLWGISAPELVVVEPIGPELGGARIGPDPDGVPTT